MARDIVDPDFKPWRLGVTVFSAFATIALIVAGIGLYSVVAISTTLRLREIGIRMALGAPRQHIIRVVVGEGIAAVTVGLIAGGATVLVASHWLAGVLFETSPRDLAILFQTALILVAVSLLALLIPTVRALKTNPVAVLRSS